MAGHCRLNEYPKLFQWHYWRMLQYTIKQAKSRYGNIYATFKAITTILEKSKHGKDALCLLNVLSTLYFSPVSIQIFEDI